MKKILLLLLIPVFIGCNKEVVDDFDNLYLTKYEGGKNYTQTFYYEGENGAITSCGRGYSTFWYKSIDNRLYFSHDDYDNYYVTIAPPRGLINNLEALNIDTKDKEHKYYIISNISFLCENLTHISNLVLKSNWKTVIGKIEEYVFDGQIYERLVVVEVVNCQSCDGSGYEKNEKREKPTTIYDLFPDYNRYYTAYMYGWQVELENIITKNRKEFSIEDAGLLLKAVDLEWKIPDDAPYLFDYFFGVVKLIDECDVCYEDVLEMFPNYLYYWCLSRIKQLYELENIATNERQQFDINNAERLLRNPNSEWKIPNDAPYYMNFNSGLRLILIAELCLIWNQRK